MDEAKLEKIGTALWDRTKTDWLLTLSHSLTEPTCPTAVIRCEDKSQKWQRWRYDADTVDEAINGVIDVAYAALFEGSKATGVPWTEPTLKRVPNE